MCVSFDEGEAFHCELENLPIPLPGYGMYLIFLEAKSYWLFESRICRSLHKFPLPSFSNCGSRSIRVGIFVEVDPTSLAHQSAISTTVAIERIAITLLSSGYHHHP